MKKLFCVVSASLLLITGAFSQDYTLDSTRIHANGNPGDLFLASLIVTNNSNATITMHLQRIVKNLPANWTSCFCYPHCIAPWVDTLTFSIAPLSMDSIKPNFGTDSIPGTGYITILLVQQGAESNLQDTIFFTGSTLSTGIGSSQ